MEDKAKRSKRIYENKNKDYYEKKFDKNKKEKKKHKKNRFEDWRVGQ